MIDPCAFLSYVSPHIVETCKLGRVKHEKTSPVQLATGMKQKVSEIVRDCEVNLKYFLAKIDLIILPLGSYDVLIDMD